MDSALPDKAHVVIIGGGVVGCSVAYHLAARGCSDVVLLERRQLTSGTTWHAAGLVTQLRATVSMSLLVRRSIETFEALERDTGLSTGFRRTGQITIASTQDRLEELKRSASMARCCGIETELLTPSEIAAHHPLVDVAGLAGGLFFPGDGVANPSDTTLSLAGRAHDEASQDL